MIEMKRSVSTEPLKFSSTNFIYLSIAHILVIFVELLFHLFCGHDAENNTTPTRGCFINFLKMACKRFMQFKCDILYCCAIKPYNHNFTQYNLEMSKNVLTIFIILTSYQVKGQVVDSIYMDNGDIIIGEITTPIMGKDPDSAEIIIYSGSQKSNINGSGIKLIAKNGADYLITSFQIGPKRHKVFSRRYYTGVINLYETKVEEFGVIQLIEKDGIIKVLFDIGYEATLSNFFKECNSIGKNASKNDINPKGLILMADLYHQCVHESGRANRIKGRNLIFWEVGLGTRRNVGNQAVSFKGDNSNVPFVGTSIDFNTFITNESFENSSWEYDENYSMELSLSAQLSKLYIGPVFRFRTVSVSSDNYEVLPFGPSNYSAIEFNFRFIDIGANVKYQFLRNAKVNPYIIASFFIPVSHTFSYSEERFGNNANPILDIDSESAASFDFGVGLDFSFGNHKVGLEVGYDIADGTTKIVGPDYDFSSTRRRKGFDLADYSLKSVYAAFKYSIRLGKPSRITFKY